MQPLWGQECCFFCFVFCSDHCLEQCLPDSGCSENTCGIAGWLNESLFQMNVNFLILKYFNICKTSLIVRKAADLMCIKLDAILVCLHDLSLPILLNIQYNRIT